MAAKMPITVEREDAFLRGYVESGGSWTDACRAASPHLATTSAGRNPPGHQTWRNHLRNSLAFAERFEEAKQEVTDNLVRIAHERITYGTRKPMLYKGKQGVDHEGNPAYETKFPDHLLLAKLRAFLPEYRDTKEININVRGHWTLSAADLEALNESDLATFTGLLERIRDHRQHATTPAVIEHQAEEIDHMARIEHELEREENE